MTSEVITIKVGSHAMPIPSEDGAKVIPSDETEAGTSSTQVAGLTDALRPVCPGLLTSLNVGHTLD